MVIIAIPQVDAEQDDVVAEGGAAGAIGAVGDGVDDEVACIDDIDEPPPQALKAVISKVQVAVDTQPRRVIVLGRLIPSIEVLPLANRCVSEYLRAKDWLPSGCPPRSESSCGIQSVVVAGVLRRPFAPARVRRHRAGFRHPSAGLISLKSNNLRSLGYL
jgi:hypothetical protein